MKINEELLCFIWQFQYFKKNGLRTQQGDKVIIMHPGYRNENAGPDFSEARVKVGDIEWIGNVEIHVRSSDWKLHAHDTDPNYENVVLHVVWKDDMSIERIDRSEIPAIHIDKRVNPAVIEKYNRITGESRVIACLGQWQKLNPLILYSQFDRALAERLNDKAEFVLQILESTRSDWEQTAYLTLTRNFGFKVNSDPFFRLGKSLPLNTLLKFSDDLTQIESMIFGFAGFLDEDPRDDYHNFLRNEYLYLQKKFNLPQSLLKRHHWKFLRLRPSNFPTIRLAQFAALIQSIHNFFSLITGDSGFQNIMTTISITQSDYWRNHYDFGKEAPKKIPSIGRNSLHNILINTVIPVLFAYGVYMDNESWKEKAISYLSELDFESNKITRQYSDYGFKKKTAFESQAMIELFHNYCLKKKCLNCNIGTSLIGPN